MKTRLLITMMAFASYSVNAQLTKGNDFISASGAFYYAPSTTESTTNGVTSPPVKDNKSYSLNGNISYGRFLKDNLALTIGVYTNYAESVRNEQSFYNDSTYNRNQNGYNTNEIGGTIGLHRFYPLWKDRFFITAGATLSGGYLYSDSKYISSYQNGSFTYNDNTAFDQSGFVSRLSIGAGAYFFINKHWSLSTRLSVFNMNYSRLTRTDDAVRTSTDPVMPYRSIQSKTTINSFEASFSPFIQPLSLTWGVSYFF